MKDLKIKAHIPVQQYGFVEVEGTENDLDKIEKLYNQYAKDPIEFSEGVFKELKTFTGETILYNTKTHTYKDLDGNYLTGGSTYKKSLEKPFNLELISQKVADKYGVEQQVVKDMWSHNSKTSRYLGNAIHNAMEQWFKYRGKIEEKDYHLPNHGWLKSLVESFPLKDEDIIPEVLVSDVKKGRAGQIDGIHKLGEKKCNIIDFKSDGKIKKNVDGHFHQLSFYAHVLMAFGWEVEELQVWNYVDEWKSFESEVLELKVGN